jgi:hypothetical protein
MTESSWFVTKELGPERKFDCHRSDSHDGPLKNNNKDLYIFNAKHVNLLLDLVAMEFG